MNTHIIILDGVHVNLKMANIYQMVCFGGDEDGINNNIFRKNNFIYKSKNENYQKRLPFFETGDIIVLSYNSVLHQLSFECESDNGTLNSFIKNLPQNTTCYWFVGH